MKDYVQEDKIKLVSKLIEDIEFDWNDLGPHRIIAKYDLAPFKSTISTKREVMNLLLRKIEESEPKVIRVMGTNYTDKYKEFEEFKSRVVDDYIELLKLHPVNEIIDRLKNKLNNITDVDAHYSADLKEEEPIRVTLTASDSFMYFLRFYIDGTRDVFKSLNSYVSAVRLTADELKLFDSLGFSLRVDYKRLDQNIDDWFWEIDVENLKDQSKALDSPSVEGLTNVKENQVNRLKLELERLGYKLIQDVNNVLLYRRFVQSVEELIEFHRYRRTVRKFAIKLYGDNREQIEMNNDERDLFLSEEYTII